MLPYLLRALEKIGVKLGVGHVLNVRVGSADRGGIKGFSGYRP